MGAITGDLPRSAGAVVIGGGVMGAAALYYLTELGCGQPVENIEFVRTLEKILGKLRLKIADALRGDLRVHHAKGTPAEIDRGGGKRLVHGHQEISGTQNAAF